MKANWRKIIKVTALLAVLGTVLLAAAGWMLISPDSPLNRASAIKASRAWARLEPFPRSAGEMKIRITGSMFTREFYISFTAPPEDIQKWLDASAGTREAKKRQDFGTVVYEIAPGEGAQFAQVTLSRDKRTIFIRTYWS